MYVGHINIMFIKIKHSDKIIKIKHENQTVADLHKIVQEKCGLTKPFKIAYLDSEQDHITITSDDDLRMGIEEIKEFTTSEDGQVPTITIVVIEDEDASPFNTNVSQVLPQNLFNSNQGNQMETEKINAQYHNQAPKPNSNGLFSAGGINYPTQTQTQQPQQAQTSLFGNAQTPNPTAQVTNTGLFQGLAPQQQAQRTGGLFSNATPSQPTLFSTPLNYASHIPQPTFAQNFYENPANQLFVAYGHQNVGFCLPRPKPTTTRHTGITCDHCRVSPIIGRRYKSVNRHDFDLCGRCVNYPQYIHMKFLMIQTNNPSDPSLNIPNFNQVINYFNSSGNVFHPSPVNVYPLFPAPHINPSRPRHILFAKLKSAFPGDPEIQIDDFLYNNGISTYEDGYPKYVMRYHCGR